MGGYYSDAEPGTHIQPFSRAVQFHGHICPGLAIGYYASHIAMRWLYRELPEGSEIAVIAESGGCAVDAIQVITGCTIGKGSLTIRDSGKQAFTFVTKENGKGLRIALKAEFAPANLDPGLAGLQQKVSSGTASGEEAADLQQRIERICRQILESPGDQVFAISEAAIRLSEPDRSYETAVCAKCGEPVRLSRAIRTATGHVCRPCHGEP